MTGLALGWFPDGGGEVNTTVSNQTISIVVVYRTEDNASEAKSAQNHLLSSTLDTIRYNKANRQAVVSVTADCLAWIIDPDYKPSDVKCCWKGLCTVSEIQLSGLLNILISSFIKAWPWLAVHFREYAFNIYLFYPFSMYSFNLSILQKNRNFLISQ